MSAAPKKIVLAYSGGLDTSVILPWLKSRYPGVKLVAFAAELGQGDELANIEKKAYKSGADEVIVKDLRKEFAEEYCFPMLRAHATYEADYLLGTSIARPLIAKHQVLVAQQTGADAVGHGATGKGNDQVRFELTAMALDPTLIIVSPWKDPRFLADGLNDRETAIEYARKHRIPITASKKKIYSQDRNLWHISHEGGEIEDPAEEPLERVYTISVPPSKAPNRPEYVEVEFKEGTPVGVNGSSYRGRGHDLIAELNRIGGRHAVGQVTLVENRLVGMKSRGVYETPGGTILYEAHKALEQLCLERDLYHFKQQAALEYGELVSTRTVVPSAARGLAGLRRSCQPSRHGQGSREAVQGTRTGRERAVAAVALRHEARELRDEGLRRHRGPRVHRPLRPADEGSGASAIEGGEQGLIVFGLRSSVFGLRPFGLGRGSRRRSWRRALAFSQD